MSRAFSKWPSGEIVTNHDFGLATIIRQAQLRAADGMTDRRSGQIITNHDLVIPEIIHRVQPLTSSIVAQRLQSKNVGSIVRELKTNFDRICNKGMTRKFQFSIQGVVGDFKILMPLLPELKLQG